MQPIAERQDLGPPSLWVFLTRSLDCTNTLHGVGLAWLIFIGLFGLPILATGCLKTRMQNIP